MHRAPQRGAGRESGGGGKRCEGRTPPLLRPRPVLTRGKWGTTQGARAPAEPARGPPSLLKARGLRRKPPPRRGPPGRPREGRHVSCGQRGLGGPAGRDARPPTHPPTPPGRWASGRGRREERRGGGEVCWLLPAGLGFGGAALAARSRPPSASRVGKGEPAPGRAVGGQAAPRQPGNGLRERGRRTAPAPAPAAAGGGWGGVVVLREGGSFPGVWGPCCALGGWVVGWLWFSLGFFFFF